MAPRAVTDAPREADLADIQGLVYRGYREHPWAGFVLARLGDDAARSRAWLAELAPRVTSTARALQPADGRLQVALSPGGLAALGVPPDVLAALPQEAKDGMAARARVLGDADPASWQLGAPDQPLDVLVMVYARDERARRAMLERERAGLAAAGAVLYPDELASPMQGKEHFGFADGLSQPFVPGPIPPRPGQDAIAAGEILLGYPNAYGELPQAPRWGGLDLGHNGTYLVFRKLRQDVAGLWSWLAARARELAGEDAPAAELTALTDLLGAKLVGRWPSGAPLVLAPDRDDPALATPERRDGFGYLALDPDGLRCPISSHVRRANPRDARGGTAEASTLVVGRHRILRRGRSFGPPLPLPEARAGRHDGADRGLYFISLQASIARGFEFVQQTWLSNPGFHGLHGEPDPIAGGGDGTCHVTIPADPLRLRLSHVPRVVDVLGGGYLFLPSLSALAAIARGQAAATS